MIIKTTARHTPSTGDGSATRVFSGQQALAGDHHRVRRESLPDSGSDVVTEYQTGVPSLSAHLRTWLVDDRTHQEPEDQLARAGAIGVDGR